MSTKVDKYIETLIDRYPDYVDWTYISRNKYLSLNFINKYKDKLVPGFIITNENIKTADIPILIKGEWKNIVNLSRYNPNIDSDFIWQNIHYFDDLFKIDAIYSKVDENFVYAFKDKIDWIGLCSKFNNPGYLVKWFPEKIHWNSLSKNPNITPEIIEKNINKIVWNELIWNPSMNAQFIRKSIDLINLEKFVTEDMPFALYKPYLHKMKLESFANINTLPQYVVGEYDGDIWSKNPNLTTDFIQTHIERIDWDLFSKNSSLSLDLIIQYHSKLNWKDIWMNSFKTEFIKAKKNELIPNVTISEEQYFIKINRSIEESSNSENTEKKKIKNMGFIFTNKFISLITIKDKKYILISNSVTKEQQFYETNIVYEVWDLVLELQKTEPIGLCFIENDILHLEINDLIIKGVKRYL